MTDTQPDAGPDGRLSTRITPRQWLVLILVQMVTLTFGMTITATNVVLPQVRGALSATQDQVAWIVTLYLVAAAGTNSWQETTDKI